MLQSDFFDDKTEAGVQAICDFYGLDLYDFLEPGDVLEDSGYEFEGLHDANHNFGKVLIALEIATHLWDNKYLYYGRTEE